MEDNEVSIIYGRHPILEAVESGKTIEKILFQQGLRGELEKEIRHLCRDHEIPLQVVPKERMNRVVSGNHQGVIAYTSPISYQNIESLLPEILEKKENPVFPYILTGIIKGKWHMAIPELFTKHQIEVDFSKRGFYVEKSYLLRKIETFKMLLRLPLKFYFGITGK